MPLTGTSPSKRTYSAASVAESQMPSIPEGSKVGDGNGEETPRIPERSIARLSPAIMQCPALGSRSGGSGGDSRILRQSEDLSPALVTSPLPVYGTDSPPSSRSKDTNASVHGHSGTSVVEPLPTGWWRRWRQRWSQREQPGWFVRDSGSREGLAGRWYTFVLYGFIGTGCVIALVIVLTVKFHHPRNQGHRP